MTDAIKNGAKVLVTVDDWFYGNDGNQYKAVWGSCRVVLAKELLGVEPRSPSTNWYLQLGSGDNTLIVAGCRVHYAQLCPLPPKNSNVLVLE